MSAKDKINAKYLALHDALGRQKDALNKVAFDVAHRKIWADCNIELKTRQKKLEAKPYLADNEKGELGDLKALLLR